MANTWEIKILYKNWTCCYSLVIGYFCRIIFKKSKQKWVSQLIGMCTKRHLEIPRNRKLDTTAQEFDLSMQIRFYLILYWMTLGRLLFLPQKATAFAATCMCTVKIRCQKKMCKYKLEKECVTVVASKSMHLSRPTHHILRSHQYRLFPIISRF